MKRKKLLTLFGSVCLILVLAALLLPACAKEEVPVTPVTPVTPVVPVTPIEVIKLRVSTHQPESSVYIGMPLKWWGEELEKRSKGRIECEFYFGGALSKSKESLDFCKRGIADVVSDCYAYYPDLLPVGNIFYATAFAPNDEKLYAEAELKLVHEFPQFAEELGKQNLVHVFGNVCNTYDLLSTVPIDSMEDLKGMKIGVIGRYHPKWLEICGATSVTTTAVDRYLSLQTGVIAASLLPTTMNTELKTYEVAKHIIGLNFGCVNNFFGAMNLDTFNKLPADIQDIVMELFDEDTRWCAQYASGELAKRVAAMESEGVTVHHFPAAEKVKMADALPDVLAEWAEDVEALGFPGWDIATRWVEICEEEGYEWPKKWAQR